MKTKGYNAKLAGLFWSIRFFSFPFFPTTSVTNMLGLADLPVLNTLALVTTPLSLSPSLRQLLPLPLLALREWVLSPFDNRIPGFKSAPVELLWRSPRCVLATESVWIRWVVRSGLSPVESCERICCFWMIWGLWAGDVLGLVLGGRSRNWDAFWLASSVADLSSVSLLYSLKSKKSNLQ